MWGPTLFGIIAAFIVLVWGMNDEKMVKGQWSLNTVMSCPDQDKYPYKMTAKKNKINRTHDSLSAYVNFDEEITDSHGAYIEFCKEMDGGWKQLYTLYPTSICDFGKEYAGNNFYKILDNMGVEPADCPIPEGKRNLTDYLVNFEDMPDEAMEGKYQVTGYITKDSKRLLCIMMAISFTKDDENDDE